MGLVDHQFVASATEDLHLRVARLERRLARERLARQEAEALAEKGLRQLYLSQQRIELLRRIAVSANSATTAEEALRQTIDELCSHTNWAFGNVFLTTDDGQALVPAGIWYANDPEGLLAFIDTSCSRRFAIGEGLPGAVLATREPCWIQDLAGAQHFARREQAREVGLHSAFAFPVLAGGAVCAVVEFFAREHLSADEEMLALVAQIGTQLGQVFERERFAAQLVHDALHDPLTGLPNRALFRDRLDQAIERNAACQGDRVGILYIDLDGFKAVNDSHGHGAGDKLLTDVSATFERTIRTCLDASCGLTLEDRTSWTLARMSGDEFTVLIEGPEVAEQLAQLANQLLASVQDDHHDMRVTASIGIAAREDDATAERLLRNADAAMYAAKRNGRAQAVRYDRAMHERAAARREIETGLRDAIRTESFELRYQPIVSTSDGALVGFEALVRWRKATGELIGPDAFIDIAEETGLIVAIGTWVLREACRQAAIWGSDHPAGTWPAISINVSPRQFLMPRFPALVRQILLETGVDPASVSLEVTETMAITSPAQAVEAMQQLAAMGVKISLDDFGTGYSSLGHLHRYPFNTLKLDRSFVSDLCRPGKATGIVRAVLDLANTMDLTVVAEGIETECQRQRLDSMGCRLAQGYLFSKPLSAAAAGALVASSYPVAPGDAGGLG